MAARSPARSMAGPERRPELRPDLGRDDRGQRGLAQARRAVQQDVIDRLRSLPRGVDQDPEVLLDPLLARELVETARAHGGLERGLFGQNLGAADPFDGHRRSLAAAKGGEVVLCVHVRGVPRHRYRGHQIGVLTQHRS